MHETSPETVLSATRRTHHPQCCVCDPANPTGLGVEFMPDGDGAVSAEFACEPRFSGYEGFIHGGVVSSLLDGAMTNCLMARGEAAVTADLQVRYRTPVLVGRPAIIRAWLVKTRRGLHTLESELEQDGEIRAKAQARFLGHPGHAG